MSQLSIAVLGSTPAIPFWLSHVSLSALCSASHEQVTGMPFQQQLLNVQEVHQPLCGAQMPAYAQMSLCLSQSDRVDKACLGGVHCADAATQTCPCGVHCADAASQTSGESLRKDTAQSKYSMALLEFYMILLCSVFFATTQLACLHHAVMQ